MDAAAAAGTALWLGLGAAFWLGAALWPGLGAAFWLGAALWPGLGAGSAADLSSLLISCHACAVFCAGRGCCAPLLRAG